MKKICRREKKIEKVVVVSSGSRRLLKTELQDLQLGVVM